MELVERDAPLQELNAAWRDATGGGCFVLIYGEAGIGKTALVEEFARQQKQTIRLWWGRCDALFTPRPLGPLYDFASRELSRLLQTDANRSAIFSTCLDQLQAQPTIAVIEDIHWADEATLDLLKHLGRRIQLTKSLLLVTYRDDELGPQHPLRLLIGDLATSPALHRIALNPLSQDGVRRLIGEHAVDAESLHRQTGGNPFFVTEVLAAGNDGVPPTVRDAVLARAARLSLSGRAVLNAAAVIGARVEPWLLDDVTRAEASAVNESLDVGMLRAQGDVLVFRHELARQAILDSIPPHQRVFLHQAALDALKTSATAHKDLVRLIHYAEAAGDREVILAYAPQAAQQASLAGAHGAAVDLYALALDHADSLTPAERADLLERYSVECDVTNQRPKAIDARRRAADIWHESGQPLKYGECLGHLALLLNLNGQNDEAERANDKAISVLEDLPDNKELIIVYNSQALLHLANLENAKGVQLAEKAVALANRLEDDERLPRLYETLGLCWLHLKHKRGIDILEKSLASALEMEQTVRVANTYANLCSVYVEFYSFEQAERTFSQGLEYVVERDLEFARLYMLAWQAQYYLLRGMWAQAEAAAQEVLEVSGLSPGIRSPALMVLGHLRARQGHTSATALLDESLDLMIRSGYRQREGLIRAALAEAAGLAGNREKAREEARVVYEWALNAEHPWVVGELAFWRWKAGDAVEVPAWVARPFALQIGGDWQAAAEAWEAHGCPYEQAHALADGDVEAQKAALVIMEQLGAQPMAELVRQTLRDAGAQTIPRGPRSATKENPFQLTNRQLEILALLTENLTNAEIATRLHISPKTVDHHVSAVLAKLDVSSREDAAELARHHSDL